MTKIIKMILGGKEVAKVTDGVFENILICNHKFAPDFHSWYDNSFYNIKNSRTFEERFELVKQNNYFCFSKPSLILIAEEID